jgi:hypothetical protein
MDILWVASSALEWDLLTGDVALNYYSLQPKNKLQKINDYSLQPKNKPQKIKKSWFNNSIVVY